MFPDMKHLLEVGLQILFYATPVMYPPRLLQERGLSGIVDYNPIGAILTLVRQPILEGQIPSLDVIAVAIGTVAVTTVLATIALVRLQRKLIFYL
jgi:lipopolysaccharide transport system permease protein